MKWPIIFITCLAMIATQANTSGSGLKCNIADSLVQSNRQWTRVKLAIEGGSPPYTITYDSYPMKWKQVRNGLYAPKEELSHENRKFPCQVRITDKSGKKLKATVVFVSSEKKLYLSQKMYEYNQNFKPDFFTSGGKPEMYFEKHLDREKQLKTKIEELKREYFESSENRQISQFTRISSVPGAGVANFRETIAYNLNKSFDVKVSDILYSEKQRVFEEERKSLFWMESNVEESQKSSENKFSLINLLSKFRDTLDKEKQLQREQEERRRTNNGLPINSPLNTPTLEENARQLPSNPSSSGKNIQSETTKPSIQKSPTTNAPLLPTPNQARNISTTQVSTRKTIDQIFSKLPNSIELDQIILTSDSYAILRTIQGVVTSELTCQQKISYLSDFFGRIQSAIEMKKFAGDQLAVIIDSAKREIEVLERQIAFNEKSIIALDTDKLKDELNRQLVSLEQAYNDFNTVDSAIQPLQRQVQTLTSTNDKKRAEKDNHHANIITEKLSLTEVQSEIRKTQQKLEQLKENKNRIENTLKQIETKIQQIDLQLKRNEREIKNKERQIDRLEEQSDERKIKYKNLQILAERIRGDLISGQEKENELYLEIETYKERKNMQQKKLVYRELEKIQQMVESLRKAVPSVQREIDMNNYKCNQVNSVNNDEIKGVLIYQIGSKDFKRYLESSYPHESIKGLDTTLTSQNLIITPISILDSEWVKTFGSSFEEKSLAESTQFSFKDDFNCLNPSSLITGSGILKRIEKKLLIVEDSNKQQRTFYLSPCSRLESTKSLPTVGQTIYWRGSPQSPGKAINLYRATCI